MSGNSANSRHAAPPRADRLRWAALVIRLVLGAVFLMAAISKIVDLAAFVDGLELHGNLPHWLAWTAARFVPWLELTCGLCLVVGYAVREAALLVCGLLTLFTVHTLFVAVDYDCRCFLFPGLDPPYSPWWSIFRNVLLLSGGVLLVCRRSQPRLQTL